MVSNAGMLRRYDPRQLMISGVSKFVKSPSKALPPLISTPSLPHPTASHITYFVEVLPLALRHALQARPHLQAADGA